MRARWKRLSLGELQSQLSTTISKAIQSTMHQLTTMITTEVNRALKTQLQALSPRNRKPKRSRAPNLDDPTAQRLFLASTNEDSTEETSVLQSDDLDNLYEESNSLFEANMTIRPTSPPVYESDMEEDHSHQP